MNLSNNNLLTEQRNESSMDIDLLPVLDVLKIINTEDAKVALAINKELPNIAKAIDRIVIAFKNGGRLVYIGAGTSGRIALLDAADCAPTYGIEPNKVIPLIAGGIDSVHKSMEMFEDSPESGVDDLKKIGFNSNDILVGLAASGRTPYVIGALEYANKLKATTIGITSNPNSIVANIASIAITPLVGPEVITGSSRMKAATAQKMILNMLSTVSMIRLGKVFQNLMVDVIPNNNKLIERQKKIVMQATNCSSAVADKALLESNRHVKTAIVMILFNVDFTTAKKKLAENLDFIPRK